MSTVLMYTSAYCPYCIRARRLFDAKGAAYEDIRVDEDASQRQKMMELSGCSSVPQIWIGSQHIGGCDELMALEGQHELDNLLLLNKAE